MSFLEIFRRKPEDAPVPDLGRERLFSTHFEGGRVPRAADVMAHLNASLKAARPKPVAPAGSAMDGVDLEGCEPAGLGAPNISEALFAWYGLQTYIGPHMSAILAQHWFINKACTMPARDAVRHGYRVNITDQADEAKAEKLRQAVVKADKRFGMNRQMIEFVRKGRIFGVRVALFKVDVANPDEYYKNPFNPDGVTKGSYRGIVQIDPYWIMPQFDNVSISDPASPDFYEPTWWQINGKLYHKSHLCIFRTSEPTDLLKPTYLYGGIPVPQMIMERVYAAERSANEAPQLAMSKRLTTWNTDLEHILANQSKFATHMDNFSAYRDNFGVKIIDAEDKMEVHDTTLTGLDGLISGQYEIACAAANVPVTKMLGTSPKGMNSTGEYDESAYHEELETIQENDLTALLDRHHLMIARSEIEPKFGLMPGSLTVEIEWQPLDSPTAEEYADINLKRAQTDDYLVSAGAIDGEDVRNRIRRDPDSGYKGISADVPEPEPVEEPEPVAPPRANAKA